MPQAILSSLLWGPLSRLGMSWAILTLAVDQSHKWWMLAVYRIQDRGGPVYVTPFLNFHYVQNKGISYGFLPLDSQHGQILLAAFAGLAVLAMMVWLARSVTSKLVAVS